MTPDGNVRLYHAILLRNILINLYYAFVHCHISYCIGIWGCTYKTHLSPVYTLQKRALRILGPNNIHIKSEDLFKRLNILNIYDLVAYNIASIMHQIIYEKLVLTTVSLHHSHRTAVNVSRRRLILPKVNTNYGRSTLNFKGTSLWNKLDCNLTSITNLKTFLRNLKHSLIDNL